MEMTQKDALSLIQNAKMENLPYRKRFFPSKELTWCLKQVEKAGMPFKFPTFGCKKCYGRGYTGMLNVPVYVDKKEFIKQPIPCKCILETDKAKLKAFAEAKGAKIGTPDSITNERFSRTGFSRPEGGSDE